MFARFSVKKPLTIFVAVIMVIILGAVAFTSMTPDLLPSMDFPYVIVMTTYPGASPEEVESAVTKPLEQSMATLEKIEDVSSNSAENYSMVILQFSDDANMDSVTIDIREKIDTVKGSWDDSIGSPYILKINPNIMPVSVAAVDKAGLDTAKLSAFVNDTLSPKLEGVEGVASIAKSGIIDQNVSVMLSQKKIDAVNKTIQKALNTQFSSAQKELDNAKAEVQNGLSQVEAGQTQAESGKTALKEKEKELSQQLAAAQRQLDQKQQELTEGKLQIVTQLSELAAKRTELLSTREQLSTIQASIDQLHERMQTLETTVNTLSDAYETCKALDRQQKEIQAQIDAVNQNTSLSEEEKTLMIAAIESSEEYTSLQQAYQELDSKLAAYGITRQQLPAKLAQEKLIYQAACAALSTLEKALSGFDISIDQVKDTLIQIDNGLTQIESGEKQLTNALAQLENGQITLKEAKEQLNAQQASASFETSGALTELMSGQQTLAATQKELDNALNEIDSGLSQLNDKKQEALDNADANKMITMDMVSKILTAENFSMPAGYVTEDGTDYLVRVGDKFTDSEEIENLLLFDMGIDGVAPIYLRDVADVFITDNASEIYAKINGNNGVILSFTKQSTYATADVSENLRKAFSSLEEEYDGLHFTSLMDQGNYIFIIVDSVLQNLLFGAALAILILLFFLKDIKPTLIIACSIPVSVVFAIVLMYFSGVTLNMISLSGLAVGVGMLVDNSVVVIENIYRLKSKGMSAAKAAVSGAVQVTGAITASTLTTVCVFLPIIFVQGITRQLFTDMALTIGYSLLASLIVALTLVPAMSQSMLRKTRTVKHGLFDKMLHVYERSARFSLKHKILPIALSVILLVLSIFLAMQKGFIFMPDSEGESISVTVEMPEDATFEDTAKVTDSVMKKAQALDGVDTVGAMIGSNGMASMMGMGESTGGTAVTMYLMPKENASVSNAGIAKALEEQCKDLPCTVKADASSGMMSMSSLGGSGVTLKLYGNDLDVLQKTAQGIGKTIETVDGIEQVDNGVENTTPEIRITVDKTKAMQHGLTVAQVYMDISAAIQTETASTTLTTNGMDLDVIVVEDASAQTTPNDIKNYTLTVTKEDGSEEKIALKDIAKIEDTQSLSAIARDNQRRYISVSATVKDGYNVTLVTADVQKALESYDLPSGFSIAYAGENEMIMDSLYELLKMMLMAVAIIYLIMVAQFQSFRSPFIVMFTIPLAFTGGLLALLLTGNEISVISMIGFVMLAGIIVNNGIVLIDYINQLRIGGLDKKEAIIQAAKTRMRPILMTALTTILGLSTMALALGTGAELMQPVAIVCIGGLLYATIMTLYVVPALYDLFSRRHMRVIKDEDLEITNE